MTLLLGSSLTHAQKQEGQVTLQFISFPKASEPEAVQLYQGDGEMIEVEIPTNRISQAYSVKPMERWIIGENIENEEGQIEFKPLGKANSIDSKKQLILIIRKSRNNDDGLILLPMPNNDTKFGGGSYFFMNATPIDIAGILSDEKFVLKPGKHTVVKPSPSETKGIYKYCKTQLLYRKGDDVRSFFSTTWRLNDQVRSMIFIYQDPDSKHIRLHTIRDYL